MGYDFSHNSGFSSILRCLCACVPIVPMYVQQYLTTPSPHGHVNRPSDAFYSTCGVNLRMMRWQDTRVCFDPAKGHQDDEEGGYIMCVCVRVVLNSWCSITLWEKCWRGRRGRLGKHRAFRWIWWGFGGVWLWVVIILKHTVSVTHWGEKAVLMRTSSKSTHVSDGRCHRHT